MRKLLYISVFVAVLCTGCSQTGMSLMSLSMQDSTGPLVEGMLEKFKGEKCVFASIYHGGATPDSGGAFKGFGHPKFVGAALTGVELIYSDSLKSFRFRF